MLPGSLLIRAGLFVTINARKKFASGLADHEALGLHRTDSILLVSPGMLMKKENNEVISNNSFFILFIGCY